MTTSKPKPMSPKDAWLYAASWGSYMTSGDPGACMYGFNERCRPQSEEHRQRVIDWIENQCRPSVMAKPSNYEPDELERMAEFLAYIRSAPIDGEDSLRSFFDAYVAAALWSTNDESDPETGGEPMDSNYGPGDISEETSAAMMDDCRKFLQTAKPMIDRAIAEGWKPPTGAQCSAYEYAGHDFWLTRCGHGCGFWDGDWPDDIGDQLTKLAKGFGECWLYVGDDGRIYS